jgi:hypothetical protein
LRPTLTVRARVRADQYDYAVLGVVEGRSDPTSILFQTILNV